MDHAVDMRGVTKRYGSVLANDGIDLSVAKGELHAIVGENGAGKSTLMHILCGLIRSDAGKVRVDGRLLPRGDPRTALGAGVGLVAQHFSLVPTLTAWENVVLGQEPTRWHCLDRRRGVEQTAPSTSLASAPGIPARHDVRKSRCWRWRTWRSLRREALRSTV